MRIGSLRDVNVRRRVMLLLSCTSFIAILLTWFDDNFMFVQTQGSSMYKTLGLKSICLVRRIHDWHDFDKLKEGDLIVFERYRVPLYECKRIRYKFGHQFWVDGETFYSFDSDHYGPLSGFQIRGKIIWYLVLR